MIMNPRRIDEPVRSIAGLPVDQVWMTGFTEAELEGVIASIVGSTNYDRYVIVSDDVIVTRGAWRALVDADHAALDDVVNSGWCNLDMTDVGLRTSSVVGSPFSSGDAPCDADYDWLLMEDVLTGPPLRLTWFTGMCLTSMSRRQWERFPFSTLDGRAASDLSLSYRLQGQGVPIYAVRDAGVFHVKEINGSGDFAEHKRLRLGEGGTHFGVPEHVTVLNTGRSMVTGSGIGDPRLTKTGGGR